MFPELSRLGRRPLLAAAMVLASVSPGRVAATPTAHPAKAAPKAVKAPARRRRPVKAVEAPPVLVPPSESADRVTRWIAASHDNGSLPYIVIDKQAAALLLFKADGTFVGQTPVLIGIGVGDDSSPGVGAKSLAEIGPAERTTPAGRFVAKFGRAFGHERVLWVDYVDSVALHAVITTHPKERRVARLLSPTPEDNRISFGCINVGSGFYGGKVSPLFRKAGGVVYILPDSKPLDDVFPRLRLLPYLGGDRSGPGKVSGDDPLHLNLGRTDTP